MLYIKDWFLQKNLTDSQRQLFADGEKDQIGETEKAVKIKVKSDNGEFTFWCPKSCLADKPETVTPEQMAEFKKNGVEMIANGHKIIVKKSEVSTYKMMGFKIVKQEEERMEELKKCYQELQKRIAEIEAKHVTHIDDFYNLDEDIRADYMGDWKEKDVQGWEYLVNRASTIRKAYRIVAEELHTGEFLPEIDQ